MIKYRAHIVAKGYVQKLGVDFDEIYAPVTRLETVRLLLALAAKMLWEVHQCENSLFEWRYKRRCVCQSTKRL